MLRVMLINLFLATHLIAAQNDHVPFENIGGFIAGTIVHTFQGPDTIQNIRVNDRLLSFDPNTGKIIHSRVKEVFQEQVDELARVVINNEEFYVNPDHRFYIADTHEWIRTRELNPDKHILLSKEGKQLTLNKVELIGGRTYIYDLTVEDTENYFVGKQQVLVHNFAFVIPIFTWVIGEGIAMLSLTTLATIAIGTACKYGVEFLTNSPGHRYQEPDNRGLNRYTQPNNYMLSRRQDDTSRSDNKKHTPDQKTVIDLAKEAQNKRGSVTTKEAETLVEWGKEAGLGNNARGPENHPSRKFGNKEHIHIGPINHLPVKD